MEPQTSFRIKFVNGDPDIVVLVEGAASFQIVAAKIRKAKEWKQTMNVRLVCAGREVFQGDMVSIATCEVLHCIATEYVPPPQVQRKPAQLQLHHGASEDPPPDWLDIVDPGTVLMWIFGSILVLLWVLFIFYAHMFDQTSLVMLCMMTFAFLIPCSLSYLPGLTFLNSFSQASSIQQQQQQHHHHQHQHHRHRHDHHTSYELHGHDPAAEHVGSLSQGALHLRQLQPAAIPPRPRARLQPLA